jgi:hypothetical protein
MIHPQTTRGTRNWASIAFRNRTSVCAIVSKTADAALTEAQNGLARERGTAVYKSWIPPTYPLRAVLKEETHQGA